MLQVCVYSYAILNVKAVVQWALSEMWAALQRDAAGAVLKPAYLHPNLSISASKVVTVSVRIGQSSVNQITLLNPTDASLQVVFGGLAVTVKLWGLHSLL